MIVTIPPLMIVVDSSEVKFEKTEEAIIVVIGMSVGGAVVRVGAVEGPSPEPPLDNPPEPDVAVASTLVMMPAPLVTEAPLLPL